MDGGEGTPTSAYQRSPLNRPAIVLKCACRQSGSTMGSAAIIGKNNSARGIQGSRMRCTNNFARYNRTRVAVLLVQMLLDKLLLRSRKDGRALKGFPERKARIRSSPFHGT